MAKDLLKQAIDAGAEIGKVPVEVISEDNIVRKEFGGSIGKVNLKFTLRTDVPDEMEKFLVLLKGAVIDVENELNKLPGKFEE